jgi:hypothetical protein
MPEKQRRMPLRDLLIDVEKRGRQFTEHLNGSWVPRAADLRELSRSVRRRSHFPTVAAVQNAVQQMLALKEETDRLIDHIVHELEEIHEHALRERMNRP